jgi:hypothetical protein
LRISPASLTLCSVLAGLLCAQPPDAARDAEQAEFLRKAELVQSNRLRQGITKSRRATLRRGALVHDAHIQTVDEGGVLNSAINLEPGFTDSFRYNLAAFELDRLLGLGMIPVTVERTFSKAPASYTWWVDDALMDEKTRQARNIRPPNSAVWNHQVYLMKVFDQLIYNVDRNTGNLLIDKRWKLWMIDHTRAFRTWKEIHEPENLARCDRELLERLRRLDAAVVRERLAPWLRAEQIEALLARRDLIVKAIDELAAQRGEQAVLYDYLRKAQ